MKYFGIVKLFDRATCSGTIEPEVGGKELSFERSAITWGDIAPSAGMRLSYDIGHDSDSKPCAVNLQTT